MPRSADELAQRMGETEELWNKQFPEEPFKPNRTIKKEAEAFESCFEYDIASASTRQQSFFYQVIAVEKLY